MSDPILHMDDYLKAMGLTHLGDLWRLSPEVRRERWAQFERDVAAGKIPTHGEVAPSTPLRLTDPIREAFADADIPVDRSMTKEYRAQCVKEGVPQKFERLYGRRQDAYVRDHVISSERAGWHALNDLCRQSDDELRLWSRRIRASRLAHIVDREDRHA